MGRYPDWRRRRGTSLPHPPPPPGMGGRGTGSGSPPFSQRGPRIPSTLFFPYMPAPGPRAAPPRPQRDALLRHLPEQIRRRLTSTTDQYCLLLTPDHLPESAIGDPCITLTLTGLYQLRKFLQIGTTRRDHRMNSATLDGADRVFRLLDPSTFVQQRRPLILFFWIKTCNLHHSP